MIIARLALAQFLRLPIFPPVAIIALKTRKEARTMTDFITPELFAHLVQLAALELSPAEAEYLRGELNNQLKAIHDLEAIPLEAGAVITSHGVPYPPEITPAIRPDTWQPHPHPGAILKQAPETDEGYIIVPEIPHTELS